MGERNLQEHSGAVGREHRQTGYLWLTRKAGQGIKIQPDIDVDVVQVEGSTVILDINYPGKKDDEDSGGPTILKYDDKRILETEGEKQVVILNGGKYGTNIIKLGIHAPGRNVVRKELLERERKEAKDLTKGLPKI